MVPLRRLECEVINVIVGIPSHLVMELRAYTALMLRGVRS